MSENKPKFTPGPWEVVLDFPPHERLYVRTPRKKKGAFFDIEKCICGCGFQKGICDGGSRSANARLIAKSPEMYQNMIDNLTTIDLINSTASTICANNCCWNCSSCPVSEIIRLLGKMKEETEKLKKKVDGEA